MQLSARGEDSLLCVSSSSHAALFVVAAAGCSDVSVVDDDASATSIGGAGATSSVSSSSGAAGGGGAAPVPRVITLEYRGNGGSPLDDGRASLPRGRFAVLNPLVRVALLEAILGYVSGNRGPVPLGPLEALCARIADHAPFRTSTLHGCVIAVQGKRLIVRPEGPRRAAEKARLGNAVP